MKHLLDSVNRNTPDELPVTVEILPAAWIKHREKLHDVLKPYEDVVGAVSPGAAIIVPPRYVEGEYTDEWGCVWKNIQRGHDGICVHHPFEMGDHGCARLNTPETMKPFYHGFMYQRLIHLMGFNLFMEAIGGAYNLGMIQMVIDSVLDYNLRRIESGLYCRRGGICYFGDDLGTQKGLAISPQTWRNYLKPCYMKIFEPLKRAGRTIFFHSDGLYTDIIQDLQDCGVDILNVQGGIQDLNALRHYQRDYGLTIDYGVNRQTLPTISIEKLNEEMYWAFSMLYQKEGGLWIRAEIAEDVPLDTIRELLEILRDLKKIHKGKIC